MRACVCVCVCVCVYVSVCVCVCLCVCKGGREWTCGVGTQFCVAGCSVAGIKLGLGLCDYALYTTGWRSLLKG